MEFSALLLHGGEILKTFRFHPFREALLLKKYSSGDATVGKLIPL